MRGRWRNASIISYQEALRAWNVFQHLQHHFAPDIVRTYHILHVWSVCELPFSAFSPRFFLSSSLLIYSIRRCDEPKRVKRRPWEEAVGFAFKRKCFTMPQPWTFYPGNDSKQFSIWTFLEVCLLIIPISDRFGKSNLDRFIFVLFCLIFPFWLRIITTAAKTDTYPCRILLLLLFCFFGFLFWTKIIEWRGKPKMGVINRGTFLFACLSVFCLFLFTTGRP